MIIVYRMFLHLTENPIISGVVLVLTCIVNRLMLEQATTLRMYMMLLWAEMLLVLAGFLVLRDAEKNKMSLGTYVYLFIVSVIGFLIHYDYWIFYAITATLFCGTLLLQAIKGKKFWTSTELKSVFAWVGNFGGSLFVTTLLFPYCKWNLNRGKGELALNSLFVFSSAKLDNIIWGYRRLAASVFGDAFPMILGLGIMFFCILGGGIVLYKKKDFRKLTGMILVVLISQAYQLVVCFTLPDQQEERYLWGVFTLMLLCMVWGAVLLLQMIPSGMKAVKRVVCTSLVIVVLVGGFLVIDGGNGVAYLFHPLKDMSVLEEHSDIPWIVYGPTLGVYSYYDWTLPEEICFVTHENTPEDATAISGLQDKDSFILYSHEGYCPQAVEFFEQTLGKELTEQYLTQSTNLNVYLVTSEE